MVKLRVGLLPRRVALATYTRVAARLKPLAGVVTRAQSFLKQLQTAARLLHFLLTVAAVLSRVQLRRVCARVTGRWRREIAVVLRSQGRLAHSSHPLLLLLSKSPLVVLDRVVTL